MLIEKDGKQMTVAKSAFKDIFAENGWVAVEQPTKKRQKKQQEPEEKTEPKKPYSEMSIEELKHVANELDIDYRKFANRDALVEYLYNME